MDSIKQLTLLFMCAPALVAGAAQPPQVSAASPVALSPGQASAHSPEAAQDVVNQYLSALRNHDLTKSYYNYTSIQFRNTTSWANYQQFIFTNSVLVNNGSASLNITVQEGTKIIFTGTMTSTDGDVKSAEVALVFENNHWRILGIKVYSPSSP
jgi:hypothetical protein